MIKFVAGFLCSLLFAKQLRVTRQKQFAANRVGPVNIPGSIFLCIGAILT